MKYERMKRNAINKDAKISKEIQTLLKPMVPKIKQAWQKGQGGNSDSLLETTDRLQEAIDIIEDVLWDLAHSSYDEDED